MRAEQFWENALEKATAVAVKVKFSDKKKCRERLSFVDNVHFTLHLQFYGNMKPNFRTNFQLTELVIIIFITPG